MPCISLFCLAVSCDVRKSSKYLVAVSTLPVGTIRKKIYRLLRITPPVSTTFSDTPPVGGPSIEVADAALSSRILILFGDPFSHSGQESTIRVARTMRQYFMRCFRSHMFPVELRQQFRAPSKQVSLAVNKTLVERSRNGAWLPHSSSRRPSSLSVGPLSFSENKSEVSSGSYSNECHER